MEYKKSFLAILLCLVLSAQGLNAENFISNRYQGGVGSGFVASVPLENQYLDYIKVTITASDIEKVYGDEHVFNHKEGDDYVISGNMAFSHQLSLQLHSDGAPKSANRGDYDIVFNNVQIHDPDNDGKDVSINYQITTVTSTLTVSPRYITVAANDTIAGWQAIVMENPENTVELFLKSLEYNVDNLVESDQDIVTGKLGTDPELGGMSDVYVGTYTLTMGSLDFGNNYVPSFTAGTLSITCQHYIWVGIDNGEKDQPPPNWHTPGAWNQNRTPDSNSYVIIADINDDWSLVTPVILEEATVGAIEIRDSKYVAVAPGTSLTVNSFINNSESDNPNHGLLIKSDETGTGSLIFNSLLEVKKGGKSELLPVKATVERYIPGDQGGGWHQLSSPIAEHPIKGEAPGDFHNGHFFTWYEPVQTWVGFNNSNVWPSWDIAHQDSTFNSARGYMVAYFDDKGNNNHDPSKEFKGDLHFGDYSLILNSYAHQEDPFWGFNLVGNPYTASIDWKHTAWSDYDLRPGLVDDGGGGHSIWVWNHEEGQYATYSTGQIGDKGTLGLTQYIPPMQGFWVRANVHGSRLTMVNEMRAHSDQDWMKNLTDPVGSLRLKVSSDDNPYTDETIVEFGHKSSTGGASKMFSFIKEAPSLYTIKGDENYSINFLCTTENHRVVPIGLAAGVNGIYLFDIEGVHAFDEDVYLEDLHTGKLQDLKFNSQYYFEANENDDPNRFLLRFGLEDETDVSDIDAWGKPVVYYANSRLNVLNPWPVNADVQLFSISGTLVDRFAAPANSESQHFVSVRPGVYVVRMQSGERSNVVRIVVGY